jgi:hypothetical protein
MTQNRRARLSPLFLLLAAVTLALSSWGLYRLFTEHADMPTGLALLVVGGLDVAAVLFGQHALTVAGDGDSSAPWNFALLVLTGLGAYAQLSAHQLDGDPIAVGLVSMAFPIVTVLLFEGQLRRRYRLQGRATGRLAQPRASVDLITWVFYRQLAMRATKLSVLDRGLDQDSALMIAERQLALEAAQAAQPAARRRMRRTYAVELADGTVESLERPAIAAGAEPDVHLPAVPSGATRADVPDEAAEEPSEVVERGAIARAVRAASGRHGDNVADVLADVRLVFPDVQEDTVRRTLRRQQAG